MHQLLKPLFAVALLIYSATASAATDPADNEGTAEHPEVSRFPGFHIDNSKLNDFNEFHFASQGYDDAGEPKGESKAGKYWFVDYILNEEGRQPSSVELIKNYENAFRKTGGSMIHRNLRSGQAESAVYRMPRPNGGERWMQIDIDNEGARYQLHIVDVGAMAQKLEVSAGEMADAIRKSGHVALTGILFDTGKASIKPESKPLLGEVVALLRNDPVLKLVIEGHTDNVGDKRANHDLSRKRAESVVKFLSDSGIDIKRLRFDGMGDSAPVADNRSEAGRAMNRRVELVKTK